ncbi:MAG: hypothetical protein FJ119_03570 [Deltaproteobacteria bacterium]|nr:hypothetical protein [Deltaproteobacteria bacterium]
MKHSRFAAGAIAVSAVIVVSIVQCLTSADAAENRGGAAGISHQGAAGSEIAGDVSVPGAKAVDNAPVITGGPFLAEGSWPLLPVSVENDFLLHKNHDVAWTFSDDHATCSGACLVQAEYQAVGSNRWTRLPVHGGTKPGFARVTLPVDILEKDMQYAFRFSVTDCAGQTTQSATYYFAVAPPDNPPVIGDGPFISSGPWPVLPLSETEALVINHNVSVLWNFSDDYASCSGPCTHRARYRKDGEEQWVWLDTVETDPTGKQYARVELPVEQMHNGTYMFRFEVRDCARQRTDSKTYYFKVDKPSM